MLDESGLAKAPDLAKVFDLYNSQTSTANTLWTIYVTVSLGVLGIIYKGGPLSGGWITKFAFSVGYIFFALSNRQAILRSQRILLAIKHFFHALALAEGSPFRQVLLAHEAVNPKQIEIGHLILTVLVLLVMWLPELSSLRG